MSFRTRTARRRTSPRGFSIIELLVAIIIIGILAAILIPIVSRRTEQARLARAQSELDALADAFERFAVDTSYYPRMFVLNDVRGNDTDGAPSRNSATGVFGGILPDSIRQYNSSGYFNTTDFFIVPATGDYVADSSGLYDQLRTNETNFNFNGPYINWQRDSNFYTGDSVSTPDGLPDDPWGNNYLFFTKEGLVLEPSGNIVPQAGFPIGSTPPILNGVDCLAFDRATVLSLGPDGLPGGLLPDGSLDRSLGKGDDIVRSAGQ